MLKFKIFIITLKNRQDRIQKLKQFYKPYLNEIIFFNGVDKNTLKKYKPYITTKFCNNYCTIPIVGCASTHILLWKYIYQNYSISDYILILEDDTYIDLTYLNTIFDEIEHLFIKNKKFLFLQLVGEGFNLKNIETIKSNNTDSLIFEQYSYHFFLGAYMLSPIIANQLFEYFYIHKINYHIDFSLNNVLKTLKIKSLILKNNYIGNQSGYNDSNMNDCRGISKLFDSTHYQKLYYALNIPILSYSSIILTFNIFFLIILFIISIYLKNVFYFLIIGMFLLEIIRFD